ncbi:recombinase family protein [Adlercreutzia equolifaciens]|uniref:recombinase family protein n=1 Tax=Adlercreutzia equolifaciens TaxID=446660 RepID=UPI00258D7436|nr:recombinase family protein [uncultured Adlercreutzia sp.]
MDYGYARVSAKDQSLARQLDALQELGLNDDVIFADKASGKDFNRPSYQRLMRKLKPGDVVFVKSIDRLGRNYQEIIEEWRSITQQKGAHIVVLDMPLLDTRNDKGELTSVFITDVVLQLLSYVAQMERDNIKQRQAEGIASAKARGVRFGRPKIERPGIYEKTKHAYEKGSITRREAADRLKVSVTTFDTWMKEDRKALLEQTA